MKLLMKSATQLCLVLATIFLSAQNTTATKQKTTTPPSASSTVAKAASPGTQEAPGGGAGKVWVNTDSNVYHCPGTRYYGKTKAGKYMTEAQAKAAGAKVAKGQSCSK